jgi:hypothetical protein
MKGFWSLMSFGAWIDRRLWLVVIVVFVAAELAQTTWTLLSSSPIMLARVAPQTRADVYSSLSSSSGALLGFSIATLAILVSFAPRRGDWIKAAREETLEKVRVKLAGVLLVTSAALGIVLALATVALGVDRSQVGIPWLQHVVLSGALAGFVGLVLSGLGFALVVIERGR